MVSLEECKKLLSESKNKYSEHQIKAIKKILYQFSEIAVSELKKIANEKECNPLREGKY